MARDTVRISPLTLLASQTIRLRRLYPKAVYKLEAEQLVLPLDAKAARGVAVVEAVRVLIEVLFPDAAPPEAVTAGDPLASATS